MGEGPLSETVSFTVTGATLNYTYPVNCIGPKTPAGLSYITGNPEVPADNPAQKDNKLGVAWAPSSEASIPSADSSCKDRYTLQTCICRRNYQVKCYIGKCIGR